MSWSTSELRVRLAHRETSLSPLVKYFYWPFQVGVSFVDNLCYYCVLLCFHARLFVDACGHLLGKGLPLRSRLWCLIVTLSLSHWYPGSGVVLDCIDSWSLPSFLLQIVQELFHVYLNKNENAVTHLYLVILGNNWFPWVSMILILSQTISLKDMKIFSLDLLYIVHS